MLVEGSFGSAGSRVIIEEFLEGEEASFFALVDGENALPLESAQDHKRVGDGDVGPNTGGMGAYSPAPIVTEELKRKVMESIIFPTVKGMAAEGCKFVGVLYAGLMIEKKSGLPKLIEYNVRFGDPECQVSCPTSIFLNFLRFISVKVQLVRPLFLNNFHRLAGNKPVYPFKTGPKQKLYAI
jgi:phosphoribosylamine---glycine ligase